MTEPSKDAWERARKLSWPQLAGQDITWLADGLQKLMDERDEARRVARVLALFQQRCQEALADGEESDAYDTAIAYPEVKP